jgi:hypothetical protein
MNWEADGEVNGRVARLAPTLQPRRRRAVRLHIMLAGNQKMPLKLSLQLLALLLFWLLQIHRKLLALNDVIEMELGRKAERASISEYVFSLLLSCVYSKPPPGRVDRVVLAATELWWWKVKCHLGFEFLCLLRKVRRGNAWISFYMIFISRNSTCL